MSDRNDGQVQIRLAGPKDKRLIERLRIAVGWSAAETGLSSMEQGRSIIYIAHMDGEPAASGALVLKAEDADLADSRTRALISNLIVDPRFQGHGLGTTLLLFLERQACRRGFHTTTIGVDASNVRARRLYERHGYLPLKDKLEAWGPVNYLGKELNCEGS